VSDANTARPFASWAVLMTRGCWSGFDMVML
jgi:hypothetical protein